MKIPREKHITALTAVAPTILTIIISAILVIFFIKYQNSKLEDEIKSIQNIYAKSSNLNDIKKDIQKREDELKKQIQKDASNVVFIFLAIILFVAVVSSIFSGEVKRIFTKFSKDLQEKNKELQKRVYIDDLTSLGNRQALQRDLNNSKYPILYILDIDSFNNINDFYGIETGNFVLKEFAETLTKLSKNKNFKIYRIGSDEFAILKDKKEPHTKDNKLVIEIIKEIKNKKLFNLEAETYIYLDITVGVAYGNDHPIEKASMALKNAKKKKASFLLYKSELEIPKEYEKDIKWTKIIKNAIDSNNIVPFYQPIVNRDKKIVKYESLIRLIDENNKVISPLSFLEIAKKSKLYPSLTEIMVEKSCKTFSDKKMEFSLNLSYNDIVDDEMIDFITKTVTKYNVQNYLTFEILESESIENYEKVEKFISKSKEIGIKIAIDDFGTGYSNFSHLLKLQPDFIKIDGSLIKDIDINKNSYTITKTIIIFAKELDIKIIAEFIHSKEVFKKAKELGADYFQGFYFSEPEIFLA